MNAIKPVWIVDDDRSIRWVLEKAMEKAGINCKSFENADDVMKQLAQEIPSAIVSDIRMPGTDGFQLLEYIQQEYPDIPVVIMTAFADLDRAVAAFKGGAFEYLPKPFDINEAVSIIQRAIERNSTDRSSPGTVNAVDNVPEMIGAAPAMQELFRAIGRLSRSNITVLLTGESGTGKELVSKALHRHSPRASQAFIALNTAAIPRELLESELFGHERGAFTGATAQRMGRFEQADGGTLFLDEIGDMPAELQTRLLRVLADGEFYRVGGTVPLKVDVRVIAATHQALEQMVEEGRFREDLFHRLNVIRLQIPSLRERREDIPLLAQHFLASAGDELGIEAKILTEESMQMLVDFDWPGNVRQIENVCRWITVMAPAQSVHIDDLPPEVSKGELLITATGGDWETALQNWIQKQLAEGQTNILEQALPRFESLMIQAALAHTGGRRQEAAKLLGWGRNTLTRKVKELDLDA